MVIDFLLEFIQFFYRTEVILLLQSIQSIQPAVDFLQQGRIELNLLSSPIDFVGYIFDFEGFRVYVAGDTEPVEEMSELGDIDLAFLPVNQPYTMTVSQCVEAAELIRPRTLVPYHYSDTDLSELPSMLPGMDVKIIGSLR